MTLQHLCDDTWLAGLSYRNQCLLQFLAAQESVRRALEDGPALQLVSESDVDRSALLPSVPMIGISAGNPAEAVWTVANLPEGVRLLVVQNALQFLVETRRFLGSCFSKVAVGGLLVLVVPHQFLFERKLRLPSRRNNLHRRFYTPNSLMAELEEAVDPCEYRVRFLADNDVGFKDCPDLESVPEGGQDLVVGIERVVHPQWRPSLYRDELWAHVPAQPQRYVQIPKDDPVVIRTVLPDTKEVGSILVIKMDHRGDFQMAKDALLALRGAYGSAKIDLACGTWNRSEAASMGMFDEIIPFDFFPEDDSARLELVSREERIAHFSQKIANRRYDLAVDLRLYDDTRELLKVVNARNKAGFDRYDSFPWLSIRLNAPSATSDDRAEEGIVLADRFSCSIGQHRTFEIRTDQELKLDRSRCFIWGPYQDFKPGLYQFECLIESSVDEFELRFDMTTDSGHRTIKFGTLLFKRGVRPYIDVQFPEKIERLEFRLFPGQSRMIPPFRFHGLHFCRRGPVRGLHQAEAMALLVRLIELRLRDPYTIETL